MTHITEFLVQKYFLNDTSNEDYSVQQFHCMRLIGIYTITQPHLQYGAASVIFTTM